MKIFGLIGYPLEHSFSKSYFENKFSKEGITNCCYKNYPIKQIEDLPQLIQEQKNLFGLNVTAPYKKSVLKYIHNFDFISNQTESVNVIKIDRSKERIILNGYNADVFGFKKSLEKHLNENIKSAMILGTGGVSQSIAYVLSVFNIDFFFVSRKNNSIKDKIYSYSNVNEKLINSVQLIINATPIGLHPNIQNKPEIPYQFINKNHVLFDLIYNPLETQFLKIGKTQGAKIINGYDMLIYQAEKSWEIFNN